MKLLRTLGIALAFLVPTAVIAAPAIRACCSSPACCPGCPQCHHAG